MARHPLRGAPAVAHLHARATLEDKRRLLAIAEANRVTLGFLVGEAVAEWVSDTGDCSPLPCRTPCPDCPRCVRRNLGEALD
jgi:hypothetical protein